MRGRRFPVARGAASLVELGSPSEYSGSCELVTRLGLRHFPPCRWLTRELDFADPISPTMPHDATRTTILSWRSTLLQGVTRSTCCTPLDVQHLSWGSFPFSAYGGRSLRRFCQPVPPGQLRSVLRVSHPLDGLLLHPPSAPFGAVTLVGFSLQGFPLPNRPTSSSLAGFPSWRSSSGLASLLLERREPGAQGQTS
jgi:hypothetical protein